MRIAFVGNMNNYPLLLALGMLRLGVDVALYVNRPELLHRPEGRDGKLQHQYPTWMFDISTISEYEFLACTPIVAELARQISDTCDAVILNDVGPSLSRLICKPSLALLTGSDLTYYATTALIDAHLRSWDSATPDLAHGRFALQILSSFVARQRTGIADARAVGFGLAGLIPNADAALSDLGVDPARRLFVYIADTLQLSLQPQPNNTRVVFLSGARVIWKDPLPPPLSDQDHKGTDVLVRGFAQFLAKDGEGELRLFRKGYNVRETECLIYELGISENVTWLDEMSLYDFRNEIRQADVVCDQLGRSFPGMAALDAMALGRPLLANVRPEILGRAFPEPWPVCHATTPQEVCAHMEGLASSPSLRHSLAMQARGFVDKYLSPEANARKCLAAIGV